MIDAICPMCMSIKIENENKWKIKGDFSKCTFGEKEFTVSILIIKLCGKKNKKKVTPGYFFKNYKELNTFIC